MLEVKTTSGAQLKIKVYTNNVMCTSVQCV